MALPARRAGMLPMRVMMDAFVWYAHRELLPADGLCEPGCEAAQHVRRPLWMLIVILMPGGIGAVVYFLLRQPMLTPLSALLTELPVGLPFLSAVPVPMAPVCGRCFRGVRLRTCSASSAGTTWPGSVLRRGCALTGTRPRPYSSFRPSDPLPLPFSSLIRLEGVGRSCAIPSSALANMISRVPSATRII